MVATASHSVTILLLLLLLLLLLFIIVVVVSVVVVVIVVKIITVNISRIYSYNFAVICNRAYLVKFSYLSFRCFFNYSTVCFVYFATCFVNKGAYQADRPICSRSRPITNHCCVEFLHIYFAQLSLHSQ